METVAVLRAGALGDVLLALPALFSIRTALPRSRIRVIGYPDIWEIARPPVDEIVAVDSVAEDWFDGADWAIAWSVRRPRTATSRVIHGSPYPPPGIHAADWLLSSLPAELRAVPRYPLIQLKTDELNTAAGYLADLGLECPVFLHPGAGAAWKRWPAERFAQVADHLGEDGVEVALVEGPADGSVTMQVLKNCRHHLSVLRNLSVRDLGACLARGQAFVGNDTGVSHLAALVGIPTIVLFGPTDPVNWQPRGSVLIRNCRLHSSLQGQVRVCYDDSCMASIPTVQVLRALGAVFKKVSSAGVAVGSSPSSLGRAEAN
jgi:ADP-heptose:LPS heptosyltransferase